MITLNGFAISLASEWIDNEAEYEKQDCELKAFKRLAEKLKKYFPKLPICILADGLYSNQTFFKICKSMSWQYIVTLKDGSLKSLWEEIERELLTSKNNLNMAKIKDLSQNFKWLNDLRYHDFVLSWIQCLETKGDETNRFVVVTSMTIDTENVCEISDSGRLRFKIENEGFNTQKNHAAFYS